MNEALSKHLEGPSLHGHASNEDLDGYIRGAHIDGEDVCRGYLFTAPGAEPDASGRRVWGWNDLRALDCKRCGKPATEHVILRAPKATNSETSSNISPAYARGATGSDDGVPTVQSLSLIHI